MGTIVQRKRGDGTVGYMAQVRVKQKGKVVHAETKTFDRKQAASAWLARRETELREPGALERIKAVDPSLAAVIDRYIAESKRDIGRTKTQVLRTIKTFDIAEMKCGEITSADIVSFAQSLKVAPQTVSNYLSHLAAIFAMARPAWGYPLEQQVMKDAFVVAKKLGITAKGRQRERRPTLAELDRILEHFGLVKARRSDAIPMQRIIPFAIFSTRRQEEIVRVRWQDFDGNRVMVRDMKHPGDKLGNDVWCDLPPEAYAIVESMPKQDDRIFPYSTDAISAAFTRACKVLAIEDLHFHDLRHEGVSRLFEMGRTIPQVASVSGHRSWQSLQRYTHLRQVGDKYAEWKWRTPHHDETLGR
ncbi:MAG TPA: site-specific integrase [Xanthobacteraceae bacterium]|nr:site-specific integrase [Xanthobacteraceae bacterium]